MKDTNLERVLKEVAAESAGRQASPAVAAVLRKAVRARAAERRAPWWRAAAAAAVLVVLGVGLAGLRGGPEAPAPEIRAVTPWYFNVGVPPVENGQLIRMDVPPETAARFGVVAAGPVEADLIIGDDGLTRAIRFVQ
jgi:hypothetical protein